MVRIFVRPDWEKHDTPVVTTCFLFDSPTKQDAGFPAGILLCCLTI
jgi:hypothetical protein